MVEFYQYFDEQTKDYSFESLTSIIDKIMFKLNFDYKIETLTFVLDEANVLIERNALYLSPNGNKRNLLVSFIDNFLKLSSKLKLTLCSTNFLIDINQEISSTVGKYKEEIKNYLKFQIIKKEDDILNILNKYLNLDDIDENELEEIKEKLKNIIGRIRPIFNIVGFIPNEITLTKETKLDKKKILINAIKESIEKTLNDIYKLIMKKYKEIQDYKINKEEKNILLESKFFIIIIY
jgi:hypothetical protein